MMKNEKKLAEETMKKMNPALSAVIFDCFAMSVQSQTAFTKINLSLSC